LPQKKINSGMEKQKEKAAAVKTKAHKRRNSRDEKAIQSAPKAQIKRERIDEKGGDGKAEAGWI
jgi:hypothetical protein